MFESLVITLREGVEAALVLAIAWSLLRRRGLESLGGALFGGAAAALVASIAVAAWISRLTFNEELAEGIVMLVGAVLVLTLAYWMWKAGPRMKDEVESGIARAAGRPGPAAVLGIFLFSFGMVFREGVETAVFLSAVGFTSEGVGMWIAAGTGLMLAAAFGVLFVRGIVRIPLKPFFTLTSAVLVLLAFQLLVGGLHELSEAEVLPASRTEMAIIGPIVKNELLLFTLTVALVAGWLLVGPRGRPQPAAVPAPAAGPEARLARAARRRERSRRRWTGIVGLAVVGFLATAFARGSQVPDKAPAEELAIEGGEVAFDAASLGNGSLRFYQLPVDGTPVRFFAISVDGDVRTCLDGCEICGDVGYFQDGVSVVCRNCTSPIVVKSLGRGGGCNPIPLPSRLDGGRVRIAVDDVRALTPLLQGR
jgi:FTR1 family protein